MNFSAKIIAVAWLIGALAACSNDAAAPAPAPAPAPTPEQNIDVNQASETETSPTTSTETVETIGETTAEITQIDAESPFADLPPPYNAADYARGRRTFKLCVSCHLVEQDAGHRVGPNLHGMFGREVGGAEGFAYSDALMDADFLWTPEKLDDWLANPRTFLPGNRMSFSGVRRPEDRDAVIAYLMVETARPSSTPD